MTNEPVHNISGKIKPVSAYPWSCSYCKCVVKTCNPIANKSDLATVSVGESNKLCRPNTSKIKMSLWNARSLKNKANMVHDYLNEHELDIMLFTECWINGNDLEFKKLENNSIYRFILNPRTKRIGGGVGCLFRSNLNIHKLDTKPTRTFEHLALDLDSRVIVILVYRSEPSNKHRYMMQEFFDEFSELLSLFQSDKRELLVTGDFNFHVNKSESRNTIKFTELLESHKLKQHINGPTHIAGNTLDLVITHEQSDVLKSHSIDELISDHNAILCELAIKKPDKPKQRIKFRKTRNINMDDFRIDLKHFFSQKLDQFNINTNSLDNLINTYENAKSILDKHAPETTKVITIRDPTPWNTEDIKALKTAKRKAEKRWRKTNKTIDWEVFKEKRNDLNRYTKEAKRKNLEKKISKNKGNSRALFKIINSELHRSQKPPLPVADDDIKLANDFSKYFTNKIVKIRQKLDLSTNCPRERNTFNGNTFTQFKELTQNEVRKIINNMAPKHSELDPVPTWMVKECLDEFLPLITEIVNKSLARGEMPTSLKHAIIKPFLKKTGLNLELKNYRPVSNLKYLSKIIESAVILQYNEHLTTNNLHDAKQSAYKPFHSTETLLTKISNDILQNGNNGDLTMLVLLDLSAAFDTIDHTILLDRLENMHGIKGTALKWFKSYLTDRSQAVIINGSLSEHEKLQFGVPQGSKLGPILFNTYITPLSEVAKKHQIDDQKYADDEQLIMAFKPSVSCSQEARTKMENCIRDIREFLSNNKLCNNGDKTEVIILTPRDNYLNLGLNHITIDNVNINITDNVKNLGVIFDKNMKMDKQVTKMCQAAYFNIRNIAQIRNSLSKENTKTVVNALVTPHLDYGNGLLYGISAKQIKKLQIAQNSAVRLIEKMNKRDHITETRKKLHWLPIQARIEYKILTLTWKIMNNQAPEYMKNLITIKPNNRSLRSANKNLIQHPTLKINNKWGSRSFSINCPKLWNNLPDTLRQKQTLESFKKSLKTHLFKEHYT